MLRPLSDLAASEFSGRCVPTLTSDDGFCEALAKLIKLVVQVLDDVVRFTSREFFVCHMAAVAQRIQRLNESVPAGIDASIMTSHAVGVMQALPVGAVAR